MIVGSNPTGPIQSHVLPELLELREFLILLLGSDGKRRLELRQMRNSELFELYEGELAFRHRSPRGLHEAKRVLGHFQGFLGEYPPSPQLAKSFLSQYIERKPTTIARYAAVLKVFLKWYGEQLDVKIVVPKTLPSYVEKSDVDRLLEAMRTKKTHKKSAERDVLLVELAIHTGLRRSELASLSIGDIDLNRQVVIVRKGKGAKDRAIPLSDAMTARLADYIEGKPRDDLSLIHI